MIFALSVSRACASPGKSPGLKAMSKAPPGLVGGAFPRRRIGRPAGRAAPVTTALGALLSHVTGGDAKTFQPMNVNFGLFPPPPAVPNKAGKLRPPKGRDRRQAMTARAAIDFDAWLSAPAIRAS